MFVINSYTTIGPFKPFRASSLKWKWHLKEYTNTAFITLPTMCFINRTGYAYENIPTGQLFTEAMPVKITAGYNGNYTTRFMGFIKRINFKVPLEIECEGYSYLLRKVSVNKIYKNTTVKAILQDITSGTSIKLSNNIPDIPVDTLPALKTTAIKVLDWLQEKMLLTVYFTFDTLYVGLYATNITTDAKTSLKDIKSIVKYRLNWNVIKDNELLFNANKEFSTVNINVTNRLANGQLIKTKRNPLKSLNTQEKKVSGISNQSWINKIGMDQTYKLNNKGYEGKITAFLEPYAEPNWASDIDDTQYPERKGQYFISGVEGSISKHGGGRQLISIDFPL